MQEKRSGESRKIFGEVGRTSHKGDKESAAGLFPAELLFFFVLAFSRFFDHKLKDHPLPFSFMDSYGFALAETLLYLALLFVFCVLVIRQAKEMERDMANLCAFLAVFLVPFFLHKNYFGTVDTMIFTVILAVSLGLVQRKNEKKQPKEYEMNRYRLAFLLLVFVPAAGNAIWLGFIKSDVQMLLSGKQFLILLLFFSPYFYAAARFFADLCREAKRRKEEAFGIYLLYACSGVIPAALWTAAGDYSRAVFYGFVCYLLPAVGFAAAGDAFFSERLKRAKEAVKKVLPVPEVFVIYPLIFITFWMMGWESIPTEEILKLQ